VRWRRAHWAVSQVVSSVLHVPGREHAARNDGVSLRAIDTFVNVEMGSSDRLESSLFPLAVGLRLQRS
jgi:hypothetical protein